MKVNFKCLSVAFLLSFCVCVYDVVLFVCVCGGVALFYSYIFAVVPWNTFWDLTDHYSSVMTEKH